MKYAHFNIGTKVEDPLVRYSQYSAGKYQPCHNCSTMFTHLGLARHLQACQKPKKAKVKK